MKFFDDSTKKVQWWNRNCFFIGTIIIVLLNIILFAVGKNNWTPYLQKNSWGDIFNFHNIWVYFLNAFEHANWQHCLLNMLCFFVAGTYIERKIGSLNLLSIVFLFAFSLMQS